MTNQKKIKINLYKTSLKGLMEVIKTSPELEKRSFHPIGIRLCYGDLPNLALKNLKSELIDEFSKSGIEGILGFETEIVQFGVQYYASADIILCHYEK